MNNQINDLPDPIFSNAGKEANLDLLFDSAPQAELPGIPAPSRACLRCGEAVPAPKLNGRPKRFCSTECRAAQKAEQMRAWHAGNAVQADRRSSIQCQQCGAAFPAPARSAGRVPRFCSSDCRLLGRRSLSAGYRARRRRVPTIKVSNEVKP